MQPVNAKKLLLLNYGGTCCEALIVKFALISRRRGDRALRADWPSTAWLYSQGPLISPLSGFTTPTAL